MPRLSAYDRPAVSRLLHREELVLTHADLRNVGVPISTVMRRIRPGGPWQRLLPGVVLAHAGRATVRERWLAALKYGGPHSLLTGRDALSLHGLQQLHRPSTHLLLPQTVRRTAHHLLVVERTHHLPNHRIIRGCRVSPVARAVVDAARREDRLDEVRAIVSAAVQQRLCTVEQLERALALAARQRTALLRAALREVRSGARSAAEGTTMRAIERSSLPPMQWNVRLYLPDGTYLGSPDGWYDDVAMALQIDSMAYHLRPADYRQTQARQRVMTQHGVFVLPYAPHDVERDEPAFIRAIAQCRAAASRRPRPDIRVVVPR